MSDTTSSGLVSRPTEIQLLVDIINALPPKAQPSEAEDLATGHRLWDILRHCSPDAYPPNLPATKDDCQKWVARHENLKRVEKVLGDVLRAEGILDIPRIDLKALAEHGPTAIVDFGNLLRMFVCTTSKQPYILECVGPVQSLPRSSQELYMNIVEHFPLTPFLDTSTTTDDHALSGNGQGAPATVEAKRDPELYREEVDSAKDKQIAHLRMQKSELEDTIRHLENRIERLRKNNQDMDEKIKQVEDNLRKNEGQGSSEAHIYSLENKIESQNKLIEEQELELNTLRKDLEQTNAELNQLRRAAEEIQPLRDQVDELQHRYEEAARKANMVDKYAQKLDAMKSMERNYRDLQGQYEELRHDMGSGSSASTEISGLRRTVDEYRRLLPAIESERHELSGMLNQAKEDMKTLEEQLFIKRDELTRAEETIAELRTGSSESLIDAGGAGLAGEMEDSERKAALEAMDPEERSKVLEKDLRDVRAQNMVLTNQLDDAKTIRIQLETRFEDLRVEKVALERSANTTGETIPPTPPPKDDEPTEPTEDEGEVARLEAENAKLRERIKLMETQDPNAKKIADAALMRQELISLRSESKLISSAWYSLNSRFQLNSAILQKKSEAPQGFLGRARGEVERAVKIRGR